MCGIVGLCGIQQASWADSMNRLNVHRGPDDSGTFRDADLHVALAMQRLSILDLEGGHQPMTTEDGRFTIVFNGEIYNSPELRSELVKKNVHFMTDHSDTEVVLNLYATEGEKMLAKLNGMFAFVIFDKEKQTLFCARDAMGIKPFYYFHDSEHFAFASELKSLLPLPFVKREIDQQSLFHYMSLMYVPGENTILKGIKRLPAAHFAIYDIANNKLEVKKWFEPFGGYRVKMSAGEWAVRIREELKCAVKRWTLADVSVGCSLSGGLDSSAIVGLLSESGYKVKTYSLGFTGKGEDYWNELPRARLVAKKWSTDHHEFILNPESLFDDLIPMVWHLDEPYGGGLPSWNVFKLMAKEVKVGLTGSGGDELFGNYGKWKELEGSGLSRLFHGPSKITKEDFREKFFERFYYFSDAEKRSFLMFCHSRPDRESIARMDPRPLKRIFDFRGDDIQDTADFLYSYYNSTGIENTRDKVAYTDICTQLPEEFLMMTDRFSMAHSLEARTPFLDKKFVELVLNIPAEIRTKPSDLKYLLKKAISDVLPMRLRYARKKGFVIPISLWLRGPLRKLAEVLLSPDRLKKQGIFQPDFYKHFVEPHIEGKSDHTNKVWAALMFQLWHHVYMERSIIDKPSYGWKDILS